MMPTDKADVIAVHSANKSAPYLVRVTYPDRIEIVFFMTTKGFLYRPTTGYRYNPNFLSLPKRARDEWECALRWPRAKEKRLDNWREKRALEIAEEWRDRVVETTIVKRENKAAAPVAQ